MLVEWRPCSACDTFNTTPGVLVGGRSDGLQLPSIPQRSTTYLSGDRVLPMLLLLAPFLRVFFWEVFAPLLLRWSGQ